MTVKFRDTISAKACITASSPSVAVRQLSSSTPSENQGKSGIPLYSAIGAIIYRKQYNSPTADYNLL